MIVQPHQAHNHGKYYYNGNGWYFRFDDDDDDDDHDGDDDDGDDDDDDDDDDDEMSYRYIILNLIIYNPVQHIQPHILRKIRKATKIINYILDTLSIEYTQHVFTHASRISHRMCSMQVSKSAWWW